MKQYVFIIKNAFDDFRRNKVRTVLTSLGIVIGVSSVVLLIALGLGLKAYIQQQFESMGTNTVYVLAGGFLSDGGFQLSGPPQPLFDDKDVKNLQKIVNTEAVIPFIQAYPTVVGDIDEKIYEITASTEEIYDVINLVAEYGNTWTKTDVEKGSKVVFIGPKVADKLFGSAEQSVNKTVKIEDQVYKVVGVAQAKGGGGFGGPSIDDAIYMPLKAAYSLVTNRNYFAIYIKAADSPYIEQIKTDAEKILLKRYKEDKFSVAESKEFLNAINSIFSVLNSILVAIAAISLIVGGVGIMNIMYVSVVERIREIGIRRAVGAHRRDILYQFLAESILLSAMGGILGLLISYGVVLIVNQVFPAYINLSTVLVAIGVSSAVGIIFGVFPAKRAADLSPIEAIRYE